MKRRNGFTLIELLAVIIILGILMIIAIPSVTQYINNSRKSAYVDTAKEIVAGVRNFVNEGKVEMYATDTTYYISASCIGTENGQKSPYGDFDQAYVLVTFDGKGYNYYWVSRDETGTGVKDPIPINNLSEENIVSDIEFDYIKEDKPQEGKIIIKVLKGDCTSLDDPPESNKICKRAKVAHTATCTKESNGCYASGYNMGATDNSKNTTTISYGNIKSKGSALAAGDAFDCDVNDDGTWDPLTERFYYVSSVYDGSTDSYDDTKAVLIYYGNISSDGTNITAPVQDKFAYDSNNKNNYGPRTGYQKLPTTTEWDNEQLLVPSTARTIRTETSATSTSGGAIQSFTYTDKAARFLTAQEINTACGVTVGNGTAAELEGCLWLMENIGQYESASGSNGYWLETPKAASSFMSMVVSGPARTVGNMTANYTTSFGVRPAIEVLKTNIEN